MTKCCACSSGAHFLSQSVEPSMTIVPFKYFLIPDCFWHENQQRLTLHPRSPSRRPTQVDQITISGVNYSKIVDRFGSLPWTQTTRWSMALFAPDLFSQQHKNRLPRTAFDLSSGRSSLRSYWQLNARDLSQHREQIKDALCKAT